MANRFHAENQWIKELQLKWIKNNTEVCQTSKSFWSGDIEEVIGSFPVQSDDILDKSKPFRWWHIAGHIISTIANIVSGTYDVEKLKQFPRIRIRCDGDYYIDERSEYDRLMSFLEKR